MNWYVKKWFGSLGCIVCLLTAGCQTVPQPQLNPGKQFQQESLPFSFTQEEFLQALEPELKPSERTLGSAEFLPRLDATLFCYRYQILGAPEGTCLELWVKPEQTSVRSVYVIGFSSDPYFEALCQSAAKITCSQTPEDLLQQLGLYKLSDMEQNETRLDATTFTLTNVGKKYVFFIQNEKELP